MNTTLAQDRNQRFDPTHSCSFRQTQSTACICASNPPNEIVPKRRYDETDVHGKPQTKSERAQTRAGTYRANESTKDSSIPHLLRNVAKSSANHETHETLTLPWKRSVVSVQIRSRRQLYSGKILGKSPRYRGGDLTVFDMRALFRDSSLLLMEGRSVRAPGTITPFPLQALEPAPDVPQRIQRARRERDVPFISLRRRLGCRIIAPYIRLLTLF